MTPPRRPVLIGVNSLGCWVNLPSGTTRLIPWRLVWNTLRPAALMAAGIAVVWWAPSLWGWLLDE